MMKTSCPQLEAVGPASACPWTGVQRLQAEPFAASGPVTRSGRWITMACLLGATKVFLRGDASCTATPGRHTGVLDLGNACGAAGTCVGTGWIGVHPWAACVGTVASHFISGRPGQRVPCGPRPARPRHHYRQAMCRSQAQLLCCLQSHSLLAAHTFTCHPLSAPTHGPCPVGPPTGQEYRALTMKF